MRSTGCVCQLKHRYHPALTSSEPSSARLLPWLESALWRVRVLYRRLAPATIRGRSLPMNCPMIWCQAYALLELWACEVVIRIHKKQEYCPVPNIRQRQEAPNPASHSLTAWELLVSPKQRWGQVKVI